MLSIPVMVVVVVTVMPPRGVSIIIATAGANSGIAAAAGNHYAETAEDQENSSDHGCAPSAFLSASTLDIGILQVLYHAPGAGAGAASNTSNRLTVKGLYDVRVHSRDGDR
jgi:hypothetical protein